MTSVPTPRKMNISTGTHHGLTFTAFGIGGVYRPPGSCVALGRGARTAPPFGVVRPPWTRRLAGFAMALEPTRDRGARSERDLHPVTVLGRVGERGVGGHVQLVGRRGVLGAPGDTGGNLKRHRLTTGGVGPRLERGEPPDGP